MRAVYEAVYKISGLTAGSRTLLYITAFAGGCVEILESYVTNASNETNEQLEIALRKVNALGTPTATTLTPSKLEAGDQAAASVVKANVTASEPTYVANTELGYQGAPSLSGWIYSLIPERRPTLAPSSSWGIYNYNAVTALDAIVCLVFREIG